MKRLFDFSAALAGLLVLAPVFLLVSVLIKLDSPGPVFFRQNRVGRDGVPFKIYKFRSMVVSSTPGLAYNTAPNDPRITRVGRFIRATSLDEIPQLINVLAGDMSIVGPRPDLQLQEQDYDAESWRLRSSVRPGVTGLAQVNGRSNLSFEERLRYDLEYVKKRSMLLDLKILLRTVMVILRGTDVN